MELRSPAGLLSCPFGGTEYCELRTEVSLVKTVWIENWGLRSQLWPTSGI